jgi:hypothetical protein
MSKTIRDSTQLGSEMVYFGGYAEVVLSDLAIKKLKAIEVHGAIRCIHEDCGHGTFKINDERPEFFSVYARLLDGTVTCIGDFETAEEANTYGAEIGQHYKKSVERFPLAKAA